MNRRTSQDHSALRQPQTSNDPPDLGSFTLKVHVESERPGVLISMLEIFRIWVLPELLASLGFLLALVFVAAILKPKRSTSSATAWLLLILLLPYMGVPLFLMFGGRKMRRLARKKSRVYRQDRTSLDAVDQGIERILASYGVPPKTADNDVKIVSEGVAAYEETLRLIDSATHQIHVLTYILGTDETGKSIIDRLAQRAAEGIKVRLLLDSVGSWRVGRRFLTPLTNAGGEVSFFMPMIHLPFRGRANLRNHRKIVVVDEQTAMMGGMNLANEYMGPGTDPRRWLDFSVVLSGPVVQTMDDLFRSDWEFASSQSLQRLALNQSPDLDRPDGTQSFAQLVASGPDVEGDPLYDALISAIYRASRRLWVVTPYFVPDDSLARALELAARRGVDVRLIIPEYSNHLLADIARSSYLKQVAKSGGKILLYTPTMLHAKLIVIDDELAVVGSANMDMRSLFLNFEVALFLSSRAIVQEVSCWIAGIFPECKNWMSKPNRARDLAEGVIRLVSPLL